MPITVSMVDVLGKLHGELITSSKDAFITRELPLDDLDYPYLGAIDVNEHTVFNPLQIRRFLGEWKKWGERARTDEQGAVVQRVENLAEECLRHSMYLKFFGD